MARESGISLNLITGSGPGGRVVRDDVEAYIASGKPRTAAPAAQAAAPTPVAATPIPAPVVVPPTPGATIVPLTSMRKTITRRLGQSWGSIPHIFVSIDVDMGAALEIRKQSNANQPKEQQFSVNDLVVKACGVALRS